MEGESTQPKQTQPIQTQQQNQVQQKLGQVTIAEEEAKTEETTNVDEQLNAEDVKKQNIIEVQVTYEHNLTQTEPNTDEAVQQNTQVEQQVKVQEKVDNTQIKETVQVKQKQKPQVKTQKIEEQKVVVKEQMSELDWELQKISLTIFDELKALQASQKWEKYNDKPCPMFKIQIDSRIATKGIGIVNYPFETVVLFLSDQTALVKLNSTCVECKVLYKKGDIFRVNYMQYKATWPVSNRDFVNVGVKRYEGPTKFYIGTKKCHYPHPEVNKVVRGQCHIGGYIIQKVDEKQTKVTYISDADIKGSIPGMVKNMLAKSQGEVAAKIQGVMKESFKKK